TLPGTQTAGRAPSGDRADHAADLALRVSHGRDRLRDALSAVDQSDSGQSQKFEARTQKCSRVGGRKAELRRTASPRPHFDPRTSAFRLSRPSNFWLQTSNLTRVRPYRLPNLSTMSI